MADHLELIAELPQVEKMATPERLKHAKKRRMHQMKKWSQREKEFVREANAKKKKTDQNLQKKAKKNDYKVHFVPSVMLLEAAARGDVEEVRRLLMYGVNPDSTNEDGLTSLHQCCIDNNEEMMQLLVEFGANVNAEDSEKWTPLHAAATCGHLPLVKYLISKKANLLAVNADGNMPYDICEGDTLDYIELEMSKRGVTQELIDETRDATERMMLDDLKWLAQQNADLEYRDAQEATPLHIASANGYKSVVEFLLDQNVSTDVVDNDLWQPIHAAACWGHLDVLELLVQNGASLDAKTKNGETPFDICEDKDIKDRMLELKNEMEIKRSAQTQKLKRSQSQNTRSHSVRRTSRREIARQDARDEAKIRMNLQGSNSEMEKAQLESEKCSSETGEVEFSEPVTETEKSVHGSNQEVSASLLQHQRGTSVQNGTRAVTSESTDAIQFIPSPNIPESLPTIATTPDVPLHVTINVEGTLPNNGNGVSTLSELKRQRMDQRKFNGSLQELTTVVAHNNSKMNGHKMEPGYNFETGCGPPSPSISIRKFTGLTSEEAMSSKKDRSCCIIL